jgi:hypothetical protein
MTEFLQSINIGTNSQYLWLTILWVLPWKGVALWKAAHKEHKWWFVALLLVNTFALLEALYIFYFSEKGNKMLLSKISKKQEQEPK